MMNTKEMNVNVGDPVAPFWSNGIHSYRTVGVVTKISEQYVWISALVPDGWRPVSLLEELKNPYGWAQGFEQVQAEGADYVGSVRMPMTKNNMNYFRLDAPVKCRLDKVINDIQKAKNSTSADHDFFAYWDHTN